jgi:hypothetical protein
MDRHDREQNLTFTQVLCITNDSRSTGREHLLGQERIHNTCIVHRAVLGGAMYRLVSITLACLVMEAFCCSNGKVRRHGAHQQRGPAHDAAVQLASVRGVRGKGRRVAGMQRLVWHWRSAAGCVMRQFARLCCCQEPVHLPTGH